jgi:hypothetical protein
MLFYTVITMVVAGWAAWRTHLQLIYVVPVGLLLTTIPHALVVWHGSGIELDRHAISSAVLFRVAILLLLFLSIDALLRERQKGVRGGEYVRDDASVIAKPQATQ